MRIFLNRLRVLFKNFFFLFNKNNMFDNKFLCTLAALIVTVVTICNITPAEGNITEKFMLGSAINPRSQLTAHNAATGVVKSGVVKPSVISNPSFKPLINNMNNPAIGAYARTEAAHDLNNNLMLPPGYVSGNYEKLYDILDETAGLNPIGTMSTLGADGLETEHVMYERQIHAISKSRTRGQGDMIRGDLLIAPCNTGWFQVSADPVADLQHGILSQIGGDIESIEKNIEMLKDFGGTFHHGEHLLANDGGNGISSQ